MCHAYFSLPARLECMTGTSACTSLVELYLSHNGIWSLDSELTQLKALKVSTGFCMRLLLACHGAAAELASVGYSFHAHSEVATSPGIADEWQLNQCLQVGLCIGHVCDHVRIL